jgi:hypothetical protein
MAYWKRGGAASLTNLDSNRIRIRIEVDQDGNAARTNTIKPNWQNFLWPYNYDL